MFHYRAEYGALAPNLQKKFIFIVIIKRNIPTSVIYSKFLTYICDSDAYL